AQEKELELLCAFEDPALLGEAGHVQGDALRIGQVLTNLIANAVKFTDHGHVKLSVGLVRRQGEQVTLRFEVRDTGIGMSEAQAQRLFQEFTQADGSTTRKYGGTGLGLSISKRLAHLMGGDIVVASKIGAGACFTFTVTLKLALGAPVPPLPKDVPRMRVLVVDDQPETGQILSHLLSSLGVGIADGGLVRVVHDGHEAVRLAGQAVSVGQPYDLVLLDWVMPGMGGAAVLARLREVQPDVLVVVISAYGSDSLRSEAREGGAHSFLPKPILPEAARQMLWRLKGEGGMVAAEQVQAADGVRLDGLHVLLVEDNALNQQLATELLCRRGARVDVVHHGREALERMRQRLPARYDLVLMDLQMPVMDGYETTKAMQEDAALREVPVVAMTAHAMTEERARCMALGMVGHIAKPLDPATLYAALAPFGVPAAPGLPSDLALAPPVHGPGHSQARRLGEAGGDLDMALPDIPGLDLQMAMHHVDGDLALLRATLAAF